LMVRRLLLATPRALDSMAMLVLSRFTLTTKFV
jgi:hypothetical protein